MNYPFIAIPDSETPQAADPAYQHVAATYVSETNKTASVWRAVPEGLLDFKPHEKTCRAVAASHAAWLGDAMCETARPHALSERRPARLREEALKPASPKSYRMPALSLSDGGMGYALR